VRYGVDLLRPPRAEQASAIFRLGWSFLGCYVGGPYLSGHQPWSGQEIAALAGIGFKFLPIWVGQQQTGSMQGSLSYPQGLQDGHDANGDLDERAFPPGCVVALDLEAGNPIPQAEEYVRGFVENLNAAGHPVCLYCDPRTGHFLGRPELVDYVWAASWVTHDLRRAPFGRFNPQDDPAWDAWQFGTGTIWGTPVDYDSVTDEFPLVSM
jgi:hypothetical protein